MKVKYPFVQHISVDKDVKFKIEYATSEIAGFIPGNDKTPDKFLVADDKVVLLLKLMLVNVLR